LRKFDKLFTELNFYTRKGANVIIDESTFCAPRKYILSSSLSTIPVDKDFFNIMQ